MNTKALEAITSPNPDEYSQWAKLIAGRCMVRCPRYLRPRVETAWNMVAFFLIKSVSFRAFMENREIQGLARFVATVCDIWGYWLNKK